MSPASHLSVITSPAPRAISLLLARGAARRFHLRLAERLARLNGVSVGISWLDGVEPLPSSVGILFELERLIHGLPAFELAERIDERAFADFPPQASPDIVIDLTGRPSPAPSAWTVTFDGHAGDSALLSALLAKRVPLVEVRSGGRCFASGQVGTEYQGILGAPPLSYLRLY